ncbi:adenylyl-sulfate kinase [Clostridium pasteurianum DSM 525 = ATCC 6013]|uniref:Adenylyl-sulfate kinase n=1 Tax=Clostridium pasteurianum DSM 525 = ATCC 6013 TaxID=1262449 RepID=A0A0H3J8N4_CLOPA|nr:adenylyl-sulfate kinase [Clostridium pasteurianum]AJA49587.1 adenylyl-sulfate kinase [Clostridium pasteurianum DSM 525 = ATCC 6013]AJA53575.1 adenylyl-sulfate kinase [Clostridium pasteurianum DSM 525 = ATCC 6013]AOZ76741.1 adenylylsulfate kinase [Clostridium pasteurianum DSM 525 = ATCC 6013]AOZ80538.1 adenylylsulfate kinase [Clostridium pasteurianum]ELP58897.1 adenylylsulfate kinase [Clostridium pasteurianum DSM 525 = ATCC 6013]
MGIKSTNIVWQKTNVSREDREKLLNQKGILIWFTGLSGSGKSTVATMLEKKLHDMGKLTYLLDGDNVRHGLNSDLGFSKEDRIENIRRIAEISKLFVDSGVITITTFISPFIKDREAVRNLLKEDFVEVYVDCPIEVCEKRDPKGIYKKARKGEIKNFTGIDSPYEPPVNPEITVQTHKNSLEECVGQIIDCLELE